MDRSEMGVALGCRDVAVSHDLLRNGLRFAEFGEKGLCGVPQRVEGGAVHRAPQSAPNGFDRSLPVLHDVDVGALPRIAQDHAQLVADRHHLGAVVGPPLSCVGGP